MPENTAVPTRADRSLTGNSKWVTPVIVVLLIALFVLSMVLGAKKVSGDEEEGFGGTDDAAATAAEEAGAKEWIKPIFEPNSGEVESGLFAMQAALGAGIAGYALGRMSGKKKGREEAEHASDLHSVDDVPEAAVTSSESTATAKS